MQPSQDTPTQLAARPGPNLVQWYGLLALLHGLLAVALLALLPGGSLGRAIPTLVLVALLAVPIMGLWRNPAAAERVRLRLAEVFDRDAVYLPAVILSLAGSVLAVYLLLIGIRVANPAFITWGAPFVLWAALLLATTGVCLRVLRFGADLQIFRSERKVFGVGGVTLALLLLLGAWMARTRIGLAPDLVGWGDPGTPLLPTQISLAFVYALAGLGVGALGVRLAGKTAFYKSLRLPAVTLADGLTCLLLWFVAFRLWGAEPLRPTYFSPTPLPPNAEYYPYSDAALYDLSAQSMLVGQGMQKDVVKPLYSLFLGLAQAVDGVGYFNAVRWQVALLAVIPALLYLLGSLLHHRLSGGFLALLAVFHEQNAIALSGVINVSHSKLLMSDLPTALGVILFTLLIAGWFLKPRANRAFPFLAGGVMALTMLVRIQTVLLVPVVLAAAWFALGRQTRRWAASSATLLVGVALVLLPWMWRNYELTGQFTFSHASQSSQAGMIGQRYSLAFNAGDAARLPGETDDEYLNRMAGSALDFMRRHPGEAARFISGQFLHNQVSTLLVLPSSFPLVEQATTLYKKLPAQGDKSAEVWERCCSLKAYATRLPYWNAWGGEWSSESRLPLLVSLVLMSVGLGAAWRWAGWAGLVPLLINLTYSLSNALVRISGWRFNLPVDWVGLLYYAIGLAQVCFWITAFVRNRAMGQTTAPADGEGRLVWLQASLVGLVLFAASAAIPLAERAFPDRYAASEPASILADFEARGRLSEAGIAPGTVEAFLQAEGAVAVVGRGLYPRYYLAGQGEPGNSWPSFDRLDYDRLGLYLVGPERNSVILPTETQPEVFPNGADVLILGCRQEDHIRALAILIFDAEGKGQSRGVGEVILPSPLPEWACRAKEGE